jgi:putative transposase
MPIYQKPNTSKPNKAHKTYPYLLGGVKITQANHVWCADNTYIPMRKGFLYLVSIMDWATRRVLSWRLSNTMDADFCVEALNEVILRFGPPKIFNMPRAKRGNALGVRTRAASWHPSNGQRPCAKQPSKSRWMEKAASWTTSSSKGFGGPSNMSAFICMPGAAAEMLRRGLVNG